MAVMHGRPGKYSKTEASRKIERLLGVMFLLLVIMAFGMGVAFGKLGATWYLTPAIVAIGAVVMGGLKLLDKPLNDLARQRIMFLRGAQGESLVGWILRDLPNDWHVFHGIKICKEFDIDHIAVGPGGLFCISTKSTRGLLSVARDGTYLLNHEPTDHLKQVQRQTMQLKDRLTALLGKVPWVQPVQPVLAMPFAWVEFNSFQATSWVLHQDNLYNTFLEQKTRLKKDEVSRLVKALEMIEANAEDIYQQPALKPEKPVVVASPATSEVVKPTA